MNDLQWRLLMTGHRSGAENMRIDEVLALDLARGVGQPTIRFYGWQPWAISLGWHQPETDVLSDEAGRDGIDVVRRPTGGRAVFHARELTYSVVMPASGRSVREVHEEISRALLAGLRNAGIEAELEAATPDRSALYREEASVTCFVSSSRSEIKVGSRKLVGSAQRRYAGPNGTEVILQHGSVLLRDDHTGIVKYLRLSDERRQAVLAVLRDRSTDVSSVLKREVSFDEMADCMIRGFAESWDIPEMAALSHE